MPSPAGERVLFVGLTGGLGAGKSTALAAFAELGAATFSTDAAVHELLGGDELREQIVARLGPGVVSGGDIDRSALAAQVFSSPADRRWLESVLWPRVGEQVAAWREQVEALEVPPPAAVVEVPLLFEAGMEEGFDKTVAVIAEEAVRAERAGARGHAAVDERSGRQLTQEEKSQRADFTVRNDGTPEELKAELSQVLATISS
ncbi:MAG: dephospho-CoA kinase [Thermoleophilaceae bacterium]|nr:dephospho-CoA kinase [Thermoleophilaceae bacterium]